MEKSEKESLDTISDEHKRWIDEASYMAMLRKNRFAPIGDPMIKGETAKYFFKVMHRKKNQLDPGEAASISKIVGWKQIPGNHKI